MTVTLANLVSYWAQESLGLDSHGPNDLTNVNAPTQAAGIKGLAVNLVRASSQYQSIADAAQSGLDPSVFTISCWIKLNSLPSVTGQMHIVAKWDTKAYRIRLSNSSNRLIFEVSSDGTSTEAQINGATFGALSAGEWYHVVAVVDGTNNYTYINTTAQSIGYSGGIDDNAAGVAIGSFSATGSGSFHFDGLIDEFSFWNAAASPDQVAALYNSGAGLNYAETVALFEPIVTSPSPMAIEITTELNVRLSRVPCGRPPAEPYSADYQLYFIDPVTGFPIDLIPVGRRIHSLKYELKLNDIGAIRFTMDATDRLVQRIINREDIICEVERRNTKTGRFEVEKAFFVRYWDIFEEENRRESIIFAGVSLEDLLRRRLVIPDDDYLGAAGFSTKSGFADIVMRDYVRDQLVNPLINTNRTFPEFYLAPFTPDTIHQTFQRRKQEDTVLDVLQDIANTSDVDFQIYRNGGSRLEFLPRRIGEDRTATRNEMALRPFVLFSTKRGNIKEPRLTYDRRKDNTVVYVAGQGIEEDRVYVPVGSTAIVRSPYNRVEALIDSRDDDSIDQILSSGHAEIHKTIGRQEFDFEVAFGRSQTRYNVDWGLGDIITAEYREVFYDFRLTEMSIEVKETGEQLSPTFEQDL